MSKTVSSISSALAAMMLDKRLQEGKEIEIPSLGIKIFLRNGEVIQIPISESREDFEKGLDFLESQK